MRDSRPSQDYQPTRIIASRIRPLRISVITCGSPKLARKLASDLRKTGWRTVVGPDPSPWVDPRDAPGIDS